jgi:hypothetical protein
VEHSRGSENTQLNFSGPRIPGAETLAKTIVALAKQGERNPIRRQQTKALSGTPPDTTIA